MKSTSRSRDQVNRKAVKDFSDVIGGDFKEAIRIGVHQYLQDLLLQLVEALMSGEMDEICGPRYQRNPDRTHTRHGFQQGQIVNSNGSKERIEKPRARRIDTNTEAVLTTYEAFNDRAVLDERALSMISAGVSERQFQNILGKGLSKNGASRSTVSRSVIASTMAALKEFEERRWERTNFVALLFDGVKVGRTMVVACVGVDLGGSKHILGIQPGATENAVVCRDLIRNLIDRGLNPDGHYLFVVDGSKALRAAIKERFGNEAVFQRCQEHKIRDVEGYLSFKDKKRIRSKMTAAYNTRSYQAASQKLQSIRGELSVISEKALNSLTEGLEDTLTLHRLKIWGGLRDSLRTTNIIESAFASLRKRTSNITNWQEEAQIERWMAHCLLKIEERFRRVPGHRSLTRLRRSLKEVYSAKQTP